MRALLSVAVIGLLVAAVSAQCPAAPASDPFAPSTCAAYVACDTAFCGCVNATSSQNNATQCLAFAPVTVNCTTVQTCMLAYTTCLQKTEANRTSSVAACNVTGTAMHNAMIAAAAGTYSGSVLQQSCRRRVCNVESFFRVDCTFGTNDSNVCMAPVTSAPVPATTAASSSAFALRATLRLSGTAYAALLNNGTARALLEAALKADLGTLLGINRDFIRILNMSVGSLIVDFAVLNGSGKSAADLNTGLAAATANTNWLTSTKAVYSTVSNETISVLSVTVTELGGSTAAPTTVAGGTTTRTPPTTSNAAATSVVAAAALAVLALAL